MKQPSDDKLPMVNGALKGRPARPVGTQTNEAFDKEVDEELQREWFQQIWNQYSGYILAAALAVVLGVGGYKLMESRRLSTSEAEGARYMAAVKLLTDGKADAAMPELTALAKGGSGFATLSRLRLAAADAEAGKQAEALAKYEALSRERGLDPILADFARLQTAMLQLDTASWGDMQSRLADLTADTSPWRHNARELLGMAARKAGKRDAARAEFERLIGDPAVPAGMAERARIVMGSIASADLAEKSPIAPAASGSTPAAVPVPAAPAAATGAPANGAPVNGIPANGVPAKK